jgi:hypothetical protein
MLRSNLALVAALGLFTTALVACGDDGGTSGTGGGGGSAPAGGITPPARPDGAPAGDGPGVLLGTSKIYIGTKTRAGADSNDAWKDFGYDLDGQVTGQDFSNHCTPAENAPPKNIFPDGNNGVDNAFGKVLLPLLKSAAGAAGSGDLEVELNNAIAEGTFNIMMDLRDLGSATSYDPVNAALLVGKEGMGSTWKVAPEFLNDPTDPASSKVTFPNSYVVDDTWVSGDKGTVTLNISIGGIVVDLNIRAAVITMKLNADHTAASDGIISGVLDTEELVGQLRDVIAPFLSCDGTTVDSILGQIKQASDIMNDGTQNPDATCNGISIGLGFDASTVTIDGVGAPAEPTTNECDMMGAGGGV